MVIHVINGERGVLKSIGLMIAWDNLSYLIDVFNQLQIEVYADQDPYDPDSTPVWQSTSKGADLLSGGYVTGGRVYINVECMSDLWVVFKNLHSGETIRLWYAMEYGVYP